ncbi:glycoside hydrolase family 47 protein [Sediminitomix flava]|uniref:Mannosidase alpha-like ER degradation enhancer 2 n=1 Tax=Sediminitomix flava TaxID=379075 RepID=A0A315ZJP1_SEDFL|nr:glycoside hydrolase family 47 protein [Sediminitomix flava]PWJ45048.1 mannosidase alpha-like ER degradation enhancer 2 [Sediminitomix flava]
MKPAISTLMMLFLLGNLISCKAQNKADKEKEIYQERVKTAFKKGWTAYKDYAWGEDAVNPIKKGNHNWYAESLLMTPVDAFSTMYLMGLEEEMTENKELIFSKLDFDKDFEVQQFEIAIRLLGGLLSSYQLDGDPRFLELAKDLGDRMIPVFDTPTGIPYRLVNLRTGEISGNGTNPCEVGSMLLEYGMLSKLTGDPKYYELCKRGVVAMYERRGKTGLLGSWINCDTGEWQDTRAHISGGIDAYYEYLLKGYLLFGDEDLKEMWDVSRKAVDTHLAEETENGYWIGWADMNTGERILSRFGALDCFWNLCYVLDGDTERAEKLQASIYKMWNLYDIEPEAIDYETMQPFEDSKYYMIRPEAIESTYYTWKATGDDQYYEQGKHMFESIEKYCQVENGYVQLSDVTTKEKWDTLESFFFAETMKYCYLFFAPEEVFDFEKYVLNTEAHPFKNTWDEGWKGNKVGLK